MDMLELIAGFLLVFGIGLSAISFIFWVLFVKDAPKIEDLKQKAILSPQIQNKYNFPDIINYRE